MELRPGGEEALIAALKLCIIQAVLHRWRSSGKRHLIFEYLRHSGQASVEARLDDLLLRWPDHSLGPQYDIEMGKPVRPKHRVV